MKLNIQPWNLIKRVTVRPEYLWLHIVCVRIALKTYPRSMNLALVPRTCLVSVECRHLNFSYSRLHIANCFDGLLYLYYIRNLWPCTSTTFSNAMEINPFLWKLRVQKVKTDYKTDSQKCIPLLDPGEMFTGPAQERAFSKSEQIIKIGKFVQELSVDIH